MYYSRPTGQAFYQNMLGRSVLRVSIKCRSGKRKRDISSAFPSSVPYARLLSFLSRILSHHHHDYLLRRTRFSTRRDSAVFIECSGGAA